MHIAHEISEAIGKIAASEADIISEEKLLNLNEIRRIQGMIIVIFLIIPI